MKKLNKKGITLVELIVSFALIAVAVTYFYQTLLTVNKLYKTSNDDTQEFVDKTYTLRIADVCLDEDVCTIENIKSNYNLEYDYDSSCSTPNFVLYKYDSENSIIKKYCFSK